MFSPWNPQVACGSPLTVGTNRAASTHLISERTFLCPMVTTDASDISLPQGDW